MQGRLVPMINGMIQAFPFETWEQEFTLSQNLGLKLIEWTLDDTNLELNPLMTSNGRARIVDLCKSNCMDVKSVTGDCFMQNPFWKAHTKLDEKSLLLKFDNIIKSCGSLGIRYLILPVVDNGSLDNKVQQSNLIGRLLDKQDLLQKFDVMVVFELDEEPDWCGRFIDQFPPDLFGINYDMGNSASNGYNSRDEFLAYGERIKNVHIKDRPLNGTTVPIGEGAVDFPAVFAGLRDIKYSGNFIMQTARSQSGQDVEIMKKYIKQLTVLLNTFFWKE